MDIYQREENFKNWVQLNTRAKKSGRHYSRAIETVSDDMIALNVIKKNLYSYTNLTELELSVNKIIENSEFIEKDTTGRHMYSKALNHYINFVKGEFKGLEDYSDLEIYRNEQKEDDGYLEGQEKLVKHKIYERNAKVIDDAKVKFKNEHNGKLFCEICEFDFSEYYGEIGESFIECHHNKPVSQMKAGDKTKIKDLAMVCSNCHRMLHRKLPWLNICELKTIISNNKN